MSAFARKQESNSDGERKCVTVSTFRLAQHLPACLNPDPDPARCSREERGQRPPLSNVGHESNCQCCQGCSETGSDSAGKTSANLAAYRMCCSCSCTKARANGADLAICLQEKQLPTSRHESGTGLPLEGRRAGTRHAGTHQMSPGVDVIPLVRLSFSSSHVASCAHHLPDCCWPAALDGKFFQLQTSCMIRAGGNMAVAESFRALPPHDVAASGKSGRCVSRGSSVGAHFTHPKTEPMHFFHPPLVPLPPRLLPPPATSNVATESSETVPVANGFARSPGALHRSPARPGEESSQHRSRPSRVPVCASASYFLAPHGSRCLGRCPSLSPLAAPESNCPRMLSFSNHFPKLEGSSYSRQFATRQTRGRRAVGLSASTISTATEVKTQQCVPLFRPVLCFFVRHARKRKKHSRSGNLAATSDVERESH